MINIAPVVLYDGSDALLWPFFPFGFPRQFLSLTGNENLIQQNAQWLAALSSDNIQVAHSLMVTGVG